MSSQTQTGVPQKKKKRKSIRANSISGKTEGKARMEEGGSRLAELLNTVCVCVRKQLWPIAGYITAGALRPTCVSIWMLIETFVPQYPGPTLSALLLPAHQGAPMTVLITWTEPARSALSPHTPRRISSWPGQTLKSIGPDDADNGQRCGHYFLPTSACIGVRPIGICQSVSWGQWWTTAGGVGLHPPPSGSSNNNRLKSGIPKPSQVSSEQMSLRRADKSVTVGLQMQNNTWSQCSKGKQRVIREVSDQLHTPSRPWLFVPTVPRLGSETTPLSLALFGSLMEQTAALHVPSADPMKHFFSINVLNRASHTPNRGKCVRRSSFLGPI